MRAFKFSVVKDKVNLIHNQQILAKLKPGQLSILELKLTVFYLSFLTILGDKFELFLSLGIDFISIFSQ